MDQQPQLKLPLVTSMLKGGTKDQAWQVVSQQRDAGACVAGSKGSEMGSFRRSKRKAVPGEAGGQASVRLAALLPLQIG